jgi:hypothetical protein
MMGYAFLTKLIVKKKTTKNKSQFIVTASISYGALTVKVINAKYKKSVAAIE